ncbi:MAG: Mut7-C RNAse domain-containing protein [Candidatus Bathyarchaeia archaeon]
MNNVFIVDLMLGRTARWLRILGFNVLYNPSWTDEDIIKIAAESNAVILTRDRKLASRALSIGLNVIEVAGKSEAERINFLLKTFGLKPVIDPSKSRCPICNSPIREASKEEVVGLVPEGVLRRQSKFWICINCGKIYWLGSHFRNMCKFLNSLENS